MNYVTLAQLAELPGARELAEVATAAHLDIVSSELMEATLREEDRSAWTVDEVATADDALQRITGAMENAESMINGFLVKRGYTVPLQTVPDLVAGWARDIGRYILHKDRISNDSSDPIVRNYNDAMKFLKMIVDGTFSLGANDPIETSPNNLDVQFTSSEKVFGREQLKNFR